MHGQTDRLRLRLRLKYISELERVLATQGATRTMIQVAGLCSGRFNNNRFRDQIVIISAQSAGGGRADKINKSVKK